MRRPEASLCVARGLVAPFITSDRRYRRARPGKPMPPGGVRRVYSRRFRDWRPWSTQSAYVSHRRGGEQRPPNNGTLDYRQCPRRCSRSVRQRSSQYGGYLPRAWLALHRSSHFVPSPTGPTETPPRAQGIARRIEAPSHTLLPGERSLTLATLKSYYNQCTARSGRN